jgi:arginine utilization protein RocB
MYLFAEMLAKQLSHKVTNVIGDIAAIITIFVVMRTKPTATLDEIDDINKNLLDEVLKAMEEEEKEKEKTLIEQDLKAALLFFASKL